MMIAASTPKSLRSLRILAWIAISLLAGCEDVCGPGISPPRLDGGLAATCPGETLQASPPAAFSGRLGRTLTAIDTSPASTVSLLCGDIPQRFFDLRVLGPSNQRRDVIAYDFRCDDVDLPCAQPARVVASHETRYTVTSHIQPDNDCASLVDEDGDGRVDENCGLCLIRAERVGRFLVPPPIAADPDTCMNDLIVGCLRTAGLQRWQQHTQDDLGAPAGSWNSAVDCMNQSLGQLFAYQAPETDGDRICDQLDNCPDDPNPSQADHFGRVGMVPCRLVDAGCARDSYGDACGDVDGDGLVDASDICPLVPSPNGAPHADRNSNGVGDHCDDPDDDGVPDSEDNCPDTPNPEQENEDGDDLGDACDCDMRPADGLADFCVAQDPLTRQAFSGRCRLQDALDAGDCLASNVADCPPETVWAPPMPWRDPPAEALRCRVEANPADGLGPGPTIDEFVAFYLAPASPMWQKCLGALNAEGQVIQAADYRSVNGCGWWYTNNAAAALAVDSYFVPAADLVPPVAVMSGPPPVVDERDGLLEAQYPEQTASGGPVVQRPEDLPAAETSDEGKDPSLRRRSWAEKAQRMQQRLSRLNFWWSTLSDSFHAVKVGFTYQALMESSLRGGPVYGLGYWFPYQDPCREYREEWLFGITDLEPIEPEVDFGFPLARFWRSVGYRNRSLDHRLHSRACLLSPQQRAELPEKNENSPLWPYLHRECECLPPVGFEDKCYDTEVDASWNRIWDFEHQIADELRVMTTDQYEAELWFHLEPDQEGHGSYGGYREGERPPHADTQGRGRFTVSFCMEPPVWARAILTNLGLTRQSSSRPTYDGAWTVWPEFANNVDPDQDPAIPTMTYDDLVDLWVTWPLLDFQGPFKASVHEDLVAAIAGLAELYHNTPPAERAPASAVANELYTFLRTLPLDGVPANLAPDFVPSNPDFIYDLFIRGSE